MVVDVDRKGDEYDHVHCIEEQAITVGHLGAAHFEQQDRQTANREGEQRGVRGGAPPDQSGGEVVAHGHKRPRRPPVNRRPSQSASIGHT